MDPILKQRLTGAIVIAMLAVIFVPMLFDEQVERNDDAPYEIPEVPGGIAIPPEPPQVDPEVVVEAPVEIPESGTATEDSGKTGTAETLPQPADETGLDQAEISEVARAPMPVPGTVTAWVIQAGSFGSRENADSLVTRLKDKGFPAFIEASGELDSKFYRVRIGPVVDRKRAELQARDIESRFEVKTIVLSYP